MNERPSEKRTSEQLFYEPHQRSDMSGKRMAKRQATSELNQDNWDKEEEQEEPGTFHKVSDKVLQGRVIKVAKRRIHTGGEDVKSPFSAFSGFNKKSSEKTQGFSCLINKPAVSNGASETKQNGLINETSSITGSDPKTQQPKEPSRDLEYYRQLKVLNESFVKWIQMHLAKNSYCDFTPVVKDYQAHIQALDTKFPLRKPEACKGITTTCTSVLTTGSTLTSRSSPDKSVTTVPTFSFKNTSSDTPSKTEGSGTTPFTISPTVSFGLKSVMSSSSGTPSFSFLGATTTADQKSTSTITSAPVSSFGTPPTTSSTFSGFSFKPLTTSEQKPFSFATAALSSVSETKDQSDHNDEDTYDPPKNEFTPVAEKEAVFNIRCKLFYKKEENFIDRGVGMLHLKPLNGKTQLLVRADTNLGNILLNIMLSASLPIQRMGKNNVLIICIPNPPVDPKQTDSSEPITFLIRVKTSEDADKLFDNLNKYKS